MSSELSEGANKRLQEIKSLSLEQAAFSCLNEELQSSIDTDVDAEKIAITAAESIVESNHKCYLFADSTAVQDQIRIVERALNWMNDGFVLNGHKYELKVPFLWTHPIGVSRNHKYKIQAWIMIDELLRASIIGSNNELLETSRDIGIDWIDQYLFGDKSDDYCWYDMGTGQRASLLAYIAQKTMLDEFIPKKLFRHSNINYSKSNILKLIVAAEIHMLELMSEERLALHSNHGLFQMAGLLAISSSLPILSSSHLGRKFAFDNIEIMFKDHFFEDGFHKEHSPMYHMFMSNFLHQLSTAGWLEDSAVLESLTKNAIESTQCFIMPNGYFTPLGDSNMRYTAESLCLFDVHRDSQQNPSSPPGLHIFSDGGVAILSTLDQNACADEHLVYSAQFHSRQHKHADDLSFNYCVNGNPYLIDAGTYTYHYDQRERIFIESTKAHNSLEIDDLNYSRFRLDAYGSSLTKVFQIGECTIFEATINHKNLVPPSIPNNVIRTTDGIGVNVSHRRLLIHKPQHFLSVIDILESDETHNYSQWFHFAPSLKLQHENEDKIEVLDEAKNRHSVIHLIVQDNLIPETTIFHGQDQPELIGWHSVNGLELKPNYTIARKLTNESAVISSVFDLKCNSRTPFVNVGSNGRYIRFSINHPESDVDITIRDIKDGEYSVTCIDGDKIFEDTYNWD